MELTMLKETGLPEKELEILKEKFIEQYASKKGWDKDNLTKDQIFEITQQSGYKSPGLLKS